MKKLILVSVICVIFSSLLFNIGGVYAFCDEKLTFFCENKVFQYDLQPNIPNSSLFSTTQTNEKLSRFGSRQERAQLLQQMLNIDFDKQIALEYLFPNLLAQITKIEKSINSPAKSAKLTTDPNSEKVFTINPEKIGIKVDRAKLINHIIESYSTGGNLTFNIPIEKIHPTITTETLSKFTNLRADFSTNISSSSSDRKHNIKNALHSLNKIEILPNEVFSFNRCVGRRTTENGYRQAKIIVNNEFVDGIGGGVCQVSSTLYNAALLAGLEICEANKHSKQVSYVKSGFDAMVNFGSSDLKFKNNTNEKLTIITNFSQSNARIRIFGESLGEKTYRLHNEVFNIVEPKEEILYDEKRQYSEKVKFEDEHFYLKRASTGMEIKTYRDTYINNKLEKRELLRHDKFAVQNAIKIFGTEKRIEKSTEDSSALSLTLSGS